MTRPRAGALLLALTTILWLTAASSALAAGSGNDGGGGQTDQSSAGKNGEPDPEPTNETETASRGSGNCDRNTAGRDGSEYESTCDNTVGRQGGNGNGKCAGCDGAADNKDPGGQDRNDRNNGYECDNNGGIARGNPAHSRCKAPPPEEPPPPPVAPPKPPPPPVIDRPSLPDEPERVLGIRVRGIPSIPDVRPARRRAAVLPFTGAALATGAYAMLGLALIGAGSYLLRTKREDETEG